MLPSPPPPTTTTTTFVAAAAAAAAHKRDAATGGMRKLCSMIAIAVGWCLSCNRVIVVHGSLLCTHDAAAAVYIRIQTQQSDNWSRVAGIDNRRCMERTGIVVCYYQVDACFNIFLTCSRQTGDGSMGVALMGHSFYYAYRWTSYFEWSSLRWFSVRVQFSCDAMNDKQSECDPRRW